MKRTVFTLLLLSVGAYGQAPVCQQSARAIFLGEKGAIAPNPGCESVGGGDDAGESPQRAQTTEVKPPTPAPEPKAAAETSVPQPPDTPSMVPAASREETAMSAMMYWIELVSPSGESERVTTERTFRSGERIRLHIQSNVTGRLTIAQMRGDGSSQLLFPDQRVNAGANVIEARADNVVPPSGYFRFDTETGTERLMVFLTPSWTPADDMRVRPGEVLDSRRTTELARNIESSKRGLILETVEEPGQTAQYVAASGGVALEIRLDHR